MNTTTFVNIYYEMTKGLEIILNPLFFWYARLDSNQRLSAPEADALSSELRAPLKRNSDFGNWNWEKFNLFLYFSQDLKDQKDFRVFADLRRPFSMASLASPTTYSEPAIQITSSGPELSIAIFAAPATSGTIDTSEMIFWAFL